LIRREAGPTKKLSLRYKQQEKNGQKNKKISEGKAKLAKDKAKGLTNETGIAGSSSPLMNLANKIRGQILHVTHAVKRGTLPRNPQNASTPQTSSRQSLLFIEMYLQLQSLSLVQLQEQLQSLRVVQ
jgi:hypothetical protein